VPETGALVTAMRAGDPDAYASAVVDLDRARTQQREQQRRDELLHRLGDAAPELAAAIGAGRGEPGWPQRWPQAWARACAVSWLAERTAPGREQRLDGELAVAVTEIHRLTAQLAAELAWRACLERMTAVQVQALQSYRNALARVGRGTGKFAERYRRDARQAMEVAQVAVPAWVMPIQQVLASVPPQPDSFDVVIVDEASQADLTSAFLLWLAPRVIVVGDDKQCTPSEVSSGALQPVFDRLDTELADIPSYLRSVFTPKDSLFSLLRTRFGQLVRLREHFRCMPEIIGWPSDTFYADAPLVPLRQFGADRLPPLRHTLVPDAEVEGGTGRVVNRAEALAIAGSVRACLDDPAYAGRTFGVVVLQSSQAQVDLIAHELRQRIDPDQWAARRIRVGIAPDFQGDERHVVWLSMVAAPNSPLRALTADTFRQSYNVAVSRAQDQLWLFHSVPPDRLNQADLRHSLLTHVLGGGSAAIGPVLTDVGPDRRHDAFDSLFEQRVFLDLTARGYHVTPQVESNRRRIDLVVTGAAGRLAVECDGEAFHSTPDQRRADLDREQELKRCGWTFERVRESLYYIDRAKALEPVWATLDRLGIRPLAAPADDRPEPPAEDAPPAPVPELEPPARDEPTLDLPQPAPPGAEEPTEHLDAPADPVQPTEYLEPPVPPEVVQPTEYLEPPAPPDPMQPTEYLEPPAPPDPAQPTEYLEPPVSPDSTQPPAEEPVVDERPAVDEIDRLVVLRSASLRGPLDPARARLLIGGSVKAATAVLEALVADGALRRGDADVHTVVRHRRATPEPADPTSGPVDQSPDTVWIDR
jgi:very-short-patch-repair endonuclease